MDTINNNIFAELKLAASDKSNISGLTHTYYRYPARFSPNLVKSLISVFTNPGDLIFDPYVGSGTTLVEAIALGRNAFGTDISSLANFISKTKTTFLTKNDISILENWINNSQKFNKLNSKLSEKYKIPLQKHRNFDTSVSWRIRKCIELTVQSTDILQNERQKDFARCVILKTSQWALDGKKDTPDLYKFRIKLVQNFHEMIEGNKQLKSSAKKYNSSMMPVAKSYLRSAIGIDTDKRILSHGAPNLVITSPPYPGIHVLYHRWQINGSRETSVPFWIANKLDGAGEAYYTMGGRHQKGIENYFENLHNSFKSLVNICNSNTIIAQVVAFSNPKVQLKKYLSEINNAGLTEIVFSDLEDRIVRQVPNRKWYTNLNKKCNGSREYLFFHRLK